MNDRRAREDAVPQGTREYTLLTVVSLLFLTAVLWQEGLGYWGLLPGLVGALAMLARWSTGPPIVLILTTVGLSLRGTLLGGRDRLMLPPGLWTQVTLAVALIVYVASHMRLLTLTRSAIPPDRARENRPSGPRVAGRGLLPEPARPRSRASSAEVVWLLVLAVTAAGVGWYLWSMIAGGRPPAWADLPRAWWRGVMIVWSAAVLLLTANAVQAYVARTSATREANLLLLQDVAWEQTRSEQRRQQRWMAWWRRKQRKKEERG